jgi:hypothetical protein
MCGPGGQTQTSSVTIPPEVLENYRKVFARGEQIAQKPFVPYSQDPNAFVAGMTPTQQASLENINAIQGMATPDVQEGQGYIRQGMEEGRGLQGMSLGTAAEGQGIGSQLYGRSLGTSGAGLSDARQIYGQALPAIQRAAMTGEGFAQDAAQRLYAGLAQAQPYMGEAANLTRMGLGAGQQYAGMAGGYLGAGTQGVGPGGLETERYMSPYLNQVVRAQQALQAEENEAQRSALKGEAIRAGAFGGDRAGIAQANLARQQSLANQATLSNLLQQGYGQAQGVAGQQQQIGLSAEQANRAAQQFGAQQAAAMGQQQFGQALSAAQQQAALGQALYAQNIGQGQAIAGLGQQQYAQGLGAAQAGAGMGKDIYGMSAQEAQLQQAAAQGMFGQAAQMAALQQSAGNNIFNYGLQGGQGVANLGLANQQAQMQAAQAQMQMGQIQQQTDQAGKTALYNQFTQQQGFPYQQAQFLGNLAMGTGALSGSTTTTNTSGSGFFSDRRLKDNAEKIGETFDGQPIYRYNYKGENRTQIGLMAQDVEKNNPKAVGLSQGYKTLDYKKATDKAVERGHFYSGGLVPAAMGGAVSPADAYEGYARGGYAQGGYTKYTDEEGYTGYRDEDGRTLSPSDYEDMFGPDTDEVIEQKKEVAPTVMPTGPVDPRINDLFKNTFGRDADKAGYEFYKDKLDKGATIESLQKELNASPEKRQQNTEAVNNLYQELMFRDADEAGRDYYLDKLAKGSSMEDIRNDISASREKNLVNQTPLTYDANQFGTYGSPVRNRYGAAAAPTNSFRSSFDQPAPQQAPVQATGKGVSPSGYGQQMGSYGGGYGGGYGQQFGGFGGGFGGYQQPMMGGFGGGYGGYQQPMGYGQQFGGFGGGYQQPMGYGQQFGGFGGGFGGYQQPSQMSQFNQGYGQGYMGGYQPMQQASGKGVGPSSYQSNYGYSNPYGMGSPSPQASGKGPSSSGGGAQGFRDGGRIGYARGGGGHLDPNDLAAMASQRMMELAPHAAGMPGQTMPGAQSYVSNKMLHVPKLVTSNVPAPRQEPGGLQTAMAHAENVNKLGSMFSGKGTFGKEQPIGKAIDKIIGQLPQGAQTTINATTGRGIPPTAGAASGPAATAPSVAPTNVSDAGIANNVQVAGLEDPDLSNLFTAARGGLVPQYALGGSLPYGGSPGGGGYIPEELLQPQQIQGLPKDDAGLRASAAKSTSGGLGDVMKAGNLGYKLAPESLKTGLKSMLPGAEAAAPAMAEGLGAAAPAAAETAAAALPAAAEAAGLGAAALPAAELAASAALPAAAAAVPAATTAAAALPAAATAASAAAPIAAAAIPEALLALLPFIGFSDRRLKENIKPIGKTYDGQTIYRYNFKGDDRTQVGLIAQEVEKKHKDAVGSSNGMKTVDYKRATEDAADRGHFYNGGLVPFRRGYADGMTVEEADLPAIGAQDVINRPDERTKSNFENALKRTLAFEGGYTVDTGGPTMAGISSRANPDVDLDRVAKDPEYKAGIYRDRYFNPIGAQNMDAKMAPVAFDTAVNLGVGRTKQLLEQAGNDPLKLLELRQQHYDNLIKTNPEKYGQYERGWRNRVNSLTQELTGGAAPRPPASIPDRTDAGRAVALAKQPSDGSFPIRPPATAKGKEQDWSDFLTSKQFVLPALTAIGTMGTTPTRDLGTALSAGLLGGVKSYQDLDKTFVELEQKKALTSETEQKTKLTLADRLIDINRIRAAKNLIPIRSLEDLERRMRDGTYLEQTPEDKSGAAPQPGVTEVKPPPGVTTEGTVGRVDPQLEGESTVRGVNAPAAQKAMAQIDWNNVADSHNIPKLQESLLEFKRMEASEKNPDTLIKNKQEQAALIRTIIEITKGNELIDKQGNRFTPPGWQSAANQIEREKVKATEDAKSISTEETKQREFRETAPALLARFERVQGILERLQTDPLLNIKTLAPALAEAVGMSSDKYNQYKNELARGDYEKFVKESKGLLFENLQNLGGRFLTATVKAGEQAVINPDIQPSANRALTAAGKGLIEYQMAFMKDYREFKKDNPYPTVDQFDNFADQWKEDNKLKTFVDRVEATTPVKGDFPAKGREKDGWEYIMDDPVTKKRFSAPNGVVVQWNDKKGDFIVLRKVQ